MSMDTIIYFYKKRGLREPVVEPVGLKAYMLVRVAVDVGKEEWFGRKLGGREAAEMEEDLEEGIFPGQMEKPGIRPWEFLRHPLRTARQTHMRKKQQKLAQERMNRAQRQREHLLAEREELLCVTEAAMRKLASEILELADDMGNCFCVYDDGVRKGLVGVESKAAPQWDWQREYLDRGNLEGNQERTLVSMWRDCFPVPEFGGYGRLFWVERLLPKAPLPHFVILGTSPDIHEVIERLAHRMKSLRWILLEEDCGQEQLDFVEDFYTEYGLAVTLQPLDAGETYRRMRLVCGTPVNVLDFTGEPHINLSEVAEGSIWLDMMSVEEKQRRIVGRGVGIVYHSLKEEWRYAQKRCKELPQNDLYI